uniref:Uncharacterized protein n=1 Tax=Anguilla anguilla TaxID=7936 RepID=A0A0E9W6G0_ANGAN
MLLIDCAIKSNSNTSEILSTGKSISCLTLMWRGGGAQEQESREGQMRWGLCK